MKMIYVQAREKITELYGQIDKNDVMMPLVTDPPIHRMPTISTPLEAGTRIKTNPLSSLSIWKYLRHTRTKSHKLYALQ